MLLGLRGKIVRDMKNIETKKPQIHGKISTQNSGQDVLQMTSISSDTAPLFS